MSGADSGMSLGGDTLGNFGNSFGFDSGITADPSSGLNSLPASLTGAGAGTMPNGFLNSFSNFLPTGGGGISSGALNGDLSFGMPGGGMGGGSIAQLLSQGLGGAAKGTFQQAQQDQNALAQGARGPTQKIKAVEFSAPVTNFAGAQSGSQAGNSLLQLLAKYRPGTSL